MPSNSCSRWEIFAVVLLLLCVAPPVSAEDAPASQTIHLSTLEGQWKLVAVLSNDRPSLEQKGALDIDWTTAGARFQSLFDQAEELHAEFVGAPLSSRGGVAGGSLTWTDPAKGKLQLSSKAPAPLLRTLESLDAGLLPHAFVLAERKGEAQFVFVRAEANDDMERESLVEQASARAQLQVAATMFRP